MHIPLQVPQLPPQPSDIFPLDIRQLFAITAVLQHDPVLGRPECTYHYNNLSPPRVYTKGIPA